MPRESFNSLVGKKVCFTCAYYNSGEINKMGFKCTRGNSKYSVPEDYCGKYYKTAKSDKQLKEDYNTLAKKCR